MAQLADIELRIKSLHDINYAFYKAFPGIPNRDLFLKKSIFLNANDEEVEEFLSRIEQFDGDRKKEKDDLENKTKYPSAEEQLEMIYKSGIVVWKEEIKRIKAEI